MTSITLIHGDAANYAGPRPDLIFTHPYGFLPLRLRTVPMIINLYEAAMPRRAMAEVWCGCRLFEVGRWGHGGGNVMYVGNLQSPHRRKPMDISYHIEDDGGWFPEELAIYVLNEFAWKTGLTVWDGFCGRGTVGLACKMMGHDYIGMDIREDRIEHAERYLGATRQPT